MTGIEHYQEAGRLIAKLAGFRDEGQPEADRMAWYRAASEGPGGDTGQHRHSGRSERTGA